MFAVELQTPRRRPLPDRAFLPATGKVAWWGFFPGRGHWRKMKGTALTIAATNVVGGAEVPTFKVSLNGFTTALNRAAELAK